MGRKIKSSKRHKKIKAIDPFYNGERKRLLYKNEDKFDVPPKDIDVQEIPKKLRDLMELREKMKTENIDDKKQKKQKRKRNKGFKTDDFGEKQPGMKIPLKPVTKFKRKRGESDESFVQRVGEITHKLVEEFKLENKFDVDFVEDKKGDVTTLKRENNDLEYEIRKKMRGVDVDRAKKSSAEKAAKRKMKEKEKKLRQKEAKIDEFKLMKDDVAFGDVVDQPPTINFRPPKSTSTANKPKSLLLQKILKPQSIQSQKLALERTRVIAEYRKQKTQKINKNSSE